MIEFTTDKVHHGYLPTYLEIAAEIGSAGHVCEVGVWHGESLTMWQTLFPEGVVVGVDHDPAAVWPPGTVRVVCSQDSPDLAGQVFEYGPYDLIVDDASHRGQPTKDAFTLLWPLVKPGGWYVVEDWMVSFWLGWEWPGDTPSMRSVVSEFLDLLETQGQGASSVTYKYGLAIVRKAEVSP
jgi:cephalosporin hydroxylase